MQIITLKLVEPSLRRRVFRLLRLATLQQLEKYGTQFNETVHLQEYTQITLPTNMTMWACLRYCTVFMVSCSRTDPLYVPTQDLTVNWSYKFSLRDIIYSLFLYAYSTVLWR